MDILLRKKLYQVLVYFLSIILSAIISMENFAYSSCIGLGIHYSFSFLNYKINSEKTGEDIVFSDIGILQNTKTYSHDYGFSLFYDDADDFDYVYNNQLRFEYYRFYIPINNTNNTIHGERFGVIYLLSYDILNGKDNQLFVGINSGFYYSKGKNEKDGYDYTTMESPLGLIIGNKYRLSDDTTFISTFTFNFYTDITGNSYLALFFNHIEDASESFITNRKEMIVNVSCAYQL